MGSDQSIPNIVAQKISLQHLQHLHATPGHSKVLRCKTVDQLQLGGDAKETTAAGTSRQ